MQEKIEFNQVRSFGEIVDDTVQFFKQNWKPLLRCYFFICGFFWVTSFVVSVFNQMQTLQNVANGESVFSLTYFLAIGFEFLNYMMINLTVLCYISLYKEKGNQAPTVEEVWAYVKYFFFRIAGSYISLGIAIAVGTVCCLIPGIYLAVVFSLVIPIIIMENATLGFAFNRSFQLIKNNWWFTLGVFFVIQLLIVVAFMAIVIPVLLITYGTMFLTTVNFLNVYSYATIAVTHLFQFLYVLPLIGIAFTYFTLTEQKENGTLLQRIMMLGKNAPAPDQFPSEEY